MNYVYVIKNLVNDKCYVGMTNNPERRWKTHKRIASNPKSVKYMIHDAIAKHGHESFSFEVIFSDESRSKTLEFEAATIAKCDSFGEKGYNLNSGGLCSMQVSERTRKLISEQAKKRFSDPAERIRHGSFGKGKKISAETKLKMSAAQKKRPPRDKSFGQKISAGQRGKKKNFSESQRLALAERCKQLSKTQQHRQRVIEMNLSRKGTTLSAEHRAKLGMSINMLDIEGNILKTFPSVAEASRELSIPYHHIYLCVKGKKISTGQYKWVFKDATT